MTRVGWWRVTLPRSSPRPFTHGAEDDVASVGGQLLRGERGCGENFAAKTRTDLMAVVEYEDGVDREREREGR